MQTFFVQIITVLIESVVVVGLIKIVVHEELYCVKAINADNSKAAQQQSSTTAKQQSSRAAEQQSSRAATQQHFFVSRELFFFALALSTE